MFCFLVFILWLGLQDVSLPVRMEPAPSPLGAWTPLITDHQGIPENLFAFLLKGQVLDAVLNTGTLCKHSTSRPHGSWLKAEPSCCLWKTKRKGSSW